MSCLWFSLVPEIGGSLGHSGEDVYLRQSQPDAGWGLMSEIVWHCVVTLLSLMCRSVETSPIVGNLSAIIPNIMHTSLLRNSLFDMQVTVSLQVSIVLPALSHLENLIKLPQGIDIVVFAAFISILIGIKLRLWIQVYKPC